MKKKCERRGVNGEAWMEVWACLGRNGCVVQELKKQQVHCNYVMKWVKRMTSGGEGWRRRSPCGNSSIFCSA